jgi:hypothetical protein
LQNMHPGLYSKDYKNKKMIVDFIKVSKWINICPSLTEV